MNVFDNTKAPYKIPNSIVRGDYVAWRNSSYVTDYPPASYTLTVNARLAGDSAGEKVVTATEDSGDYLFEVNSVDWDVGTWFFDLYVTQNADSKRATLKSGVIHVLADRAEDPDDPRVEPRRKLALVEALISDRLENRQIDTTSADNGETRVDRDFEILTRERRRLKIELRAANQKYRAKRGLVHSGNVRVRG